MSTKLVRQGLMLCLVGPVGSGKTTLSAMLLERLGGVKRSISVTTRVARPNETNGVNYFFVSREDFQGRIDRQEFFEYEEIHGNLYGTLKSTVQDALSSGIDLLLDIDIRGALNFKRHLSHQVVICFLVPPSFEVLRARVLGRGKISDEELATRLRTAGAEYAALLRCADEGALVDYLIVNDEIEDSYTKVSSIVIAERGRLSRIERSALNGLLALG